VPTFIDRSQLQKLVDQGAQLVEVLPRREFEAEHLAGAISIPLRELDRNTTRPLNKAKPVIVYCYDYQ
jgi:phage shock protein E